MDIASLQRGLSEITFEPEFEPFGLDFGRGSHPERGVPATRVVEVLDVVVDRGGEFNPGAPAMTVEKLDCMRPQNASIIALSKQEPVAPIDGAIRASRTRWLNAQEVN